MKREFHIALFLKGFSNQIPVTVCEDNPKSIRYHPGLWLGRRWSCCKSLTKIGLGCQVTTDWADQNNNPAPSKWENRDTEAGLISDREKTDQKKVEEQERGQLGRLIREANGRFNWAMSYNLFTMRISSVTARFWGAR